MLIHFMMGPLTEGQNNLSVDTFTKHNAVTKNKVLWADKLFMGKNILTTLQECMLLSSGMPVKTLWISKCENITS